VPWVSVPIVQYLLSGAFGPVKYLLGEATDDYGAADMTKGMFRKGHVKELSSLGRNDHSNQCEILSLVTCTYIYH
jgi:hypothetical protein